MLVLKLKNYSYYNAGSFWRWLSGVASLDVIDNIVPFISGEEEKTELEPLKILGRNDINFCAL